MKNFIAFVDEGLQGHCPTVPTGVGVPVPVNICHLSRLGSLRRTAIKKLGGKSGISAHFPTSMEPI